MSKVKLSENLFLEKAELNRILEFQEERVKQLVFPFIKYPGIIADETNSYFKPLKTNTDEVTINPGIAITRNLDIVKLRTDLVLSDITDAGEKQWIIINKKTSNFEDGTISIDIAGNVSGVNTKFTEVFRGQENFPTKIKIDSQINSGEYEVVAVYSDTQMVIVGELEEETDKHFSVIGAFTPGFIPNPENKQIYEFDDCEVTMVTSANAPELTDDQFIIGYIIFTDGVMNVFDERVYNMLNQNFSDDLTTTGESQITTLSRISTLGVIDSEYAKSVDFELIFSHARIIYAYTVTTSATDNIVTMGVSSDGRYGQNVPPNNIFNGWTLMNRNTGVKVRVDHNIGRDLHIYEWNSEITVDSSDLVLIPPFETIEYEIKVKTENVPNHATPFYFRNSTFNPLTRCRIYALFPASGGADTLTIGIRYRFITNVKEYPFKDFPISGYINIRGNVQLLYNSELSVLMTNLTTAINESSEQATSSEQTTNSATQLEETLIQIDDRRR